MKDYNVFIGENLTPTFISKVEFVLAQPTCGKTTLAKSSSHGNFIIDSDDIIHIVKKMYNMSGWDLLNSICFDCNIADDLTLLKGKLNDNVLDMIQSFVTILKDTIKACTSVSTEDGSKITLLFHHHSLLMWGWLAFVNAKAELRGFNPEIFLSMYYRINADAYIWEWNKRQQTENCKNRYFDHDDLEVVYNTWINQSDILYLAKLANIKVSNIKSVPLHRDVYLCSYLQIVSDHKSDLDKATDMHRYQVMVVWNVLLQHAMNSVLHHDVDKYGYESVDDWKANGFPSHIKADMISTHHKENVQTVMNLTEMVADWISASHRCIPSPWNARTEQGCSYQFNTNILISNTFRVFNNTDAWEYIWLLSQLIHHDLFDSYYHNDDFITSFDWTKLFKFMK